MVRETGTQVEIALAGESAFRIAFSRRFRKMYRRISMAGTPLSETEESAAFTALAPFAPLTARKTCLTDGSALRRWGR
jgi:hypothetical protein